jgi:hypothetical protein
MSLTIVASVAGGLVAGALLGVPGLSGASSGPAVPAVVQHGGPGAGARAGGPSAALDAAAEALGMTTDELRQRLSDGTTSIADVAREKNVDVNAVIDAIAADQRARIEDFVNNPLRIRDHGGKRGFHLGGSEKFEAVANALGMTTDELRDALRDGKTIADVAREKNVDVQTVIDAMVGAATSAIDEAQAAGRLTEEQATRLKDGLEERITAIVNGEFRGRGPGGRPWRGHRGP